MPPTVTMAPGDLVKLATDLAGEAARTEIPKSLQKQIDLEVAPPGFEDVVKGLKKYQKKKPHESTEADKKIDNIYALAWWMHNRGYRPAKDEHSTETGTEEAVSYTSHGPLLRTGATEAHRTSLSWRTPLKEAKVLDKDAMEVEVVIMSEGLGNKRDMHFYSKQAINLAAPLFEGAKAFIDHPSTTEEETRPERTLRDLIGYYKDVRADEGGSVLKGTLVLEKTDQGRLWFQKIHEAINYAERYPDKTYFAISINADGKTREEEMDGMLVNVVEEITEVESADLVTRPALQTRFVRVLQSMREADDASTATHASAQSRVLADLTAVVVDLMHEAAESTTDHCAKLRQGIRRLHETVVPYQHHLPKILHGKIDQLLTTSRVIETDGELDLLYSQLRELREAVSSYSKEGPPMPEVRKRAAEAEADAERGLRMALKSALRKHAEADGGEYSDLVKKAQKQIMLMAEADSEDEDEGKKAAESEDDNEDDSEDAAEAKMRYAKRKKAAESEDDNEDEEEGKRKVKAAKKKAAESEDEDEGRKKAAEADSEDEDEEESEGEAKRKKASESDRIPKADRDAIDSLVEASKAEYKRTLRKEEAYQQLAEAKVMSRYLKAKGLLKESALPKATQEMIFEQLIGCPSETRMTKIIRGYEEFLEAARTPEDLMIRVEGSPARQGFREAEISDDRWISGLVKDFAE